MFNPNRPYVPYTFPEVRFLKLQDYITNLVNQYGGVYWPLDDAANNPYNRVINPAVAVGRELILNGGFDSDTLWNKGTNWTISGGKGVGTAATGNISQTPQVPVVIGRAYQLTYDLAVTSGSGRIALGNTNGTVRSASGTYVENLICTALSPVGWIASTTFTGTVDNISVKELNIPAYNATPSQLLNTDVWNGLGTAAWTGSGASTLTAPTVTRHDGTSGTVLQIARVSGSTQNANSQAILTIGQVYRMYGWFKGDGTAIPKIVHNAVILVTGTATTDWQPYDIVFVAAATIVSFQNTTSTGTTFTQYDVTVIALDTGIRTDNVVQNGDFSADKNWTKGSGWTISGGTAVGTATAGDLAQSNSVVSGKRYLVTYTIAGLTSGTVTLLLGTSGAGIGAARSTNGTFSDVILCGGGTGLITVRGSGAGGFTGTVDNIVVTELSPLVGVPVNGAVLGNSEAPLRIGTSVSFDGVNDLINLYSAQLNSVINPNEGSLIIFGKYTGSWTSGLAKYLVIMSSDSNNRFSISKNAANNQIVAELKQGGTNFFPTVTTSTANWFCAVLTWSVSNNRGRLYFNGVQSGADVTGLGTFVGNLSSTAAAVGVQNTSGTNPWLGNESACVLLTAELSLSEIAEISKLGDAS